MINSGLSQGKSAEMRGLINQRISLQNVSTALVRKMNLTDMI